MRLKGKWHRWTPEEDEILRRDYKQDVISRRDIAYKLGLTVAAVQGRVTVLGIAKRTDRHPWTPKEDKKLEELMGKYAPRTVAKKMRRSVNSVVVRSKRLKISRRSRDGWFTLRDVCEILGVDHHWLHRRIATGTIKASPHDPESLPHKGGAAAWHILEEDLKDFIQRYPQELDGSNVDMIMIVDILAGVLNGHASSIGKLRRKNKTLKGGEVYAMSQKVQYKHVGRDGGID